MLMESNKRCSDFSQLSEMISGIELWLRIHDYNFIECNHVPEFLFGRNRKINVLLRTFFRLCPYNLRIMKHRLYPLTPQSLVALLKAYSLTEDKDLVKKLYERTLTLRSPQTKYFALKQGIRIAINMYENSPDTPTPLNTVWFGQFLLDEHYGIVSEKEKKELLYSISNYLIKELGYIDHGVQGVYFYYGPTLKKEVYNASAIISAFLVNVGVRFGDDYLNGLGQRGIRYICQKQNIDGSWFYAGSPERATIDCFHQSYILQAICSVQEYLSFDASEAIKKGTEFYKTMFVNEGERVRPIRYDKKYPPNNTWWFVKVDGRDISEALIFFTKCYPDKEMVRKLLKYTYDNFYDKKKGYMIPELFIYGKNHIPYIEFQAWFLYAFNILKLTR